VLDVHETMSASLYRTIEWNANDDGSLGGCKICPKHRVFVKGDGHSSIRWTNMLSDPCEMTVTASESALPISARAVQHGEFH